MNKLPVRLWLVLLVVLFAACSTLPMAVDPSEYESGERSLIHITNHGWHTGIVLEAEALLSKLPELRQQFGQYDFIEIGWGDAGFYEAKEVTSVITIRAIFWPSDSVVHVVGLLESPSDFFTHSEVKAVNVDRQNMESLLAFVSTSFYRAESGHFDNLGKSLYGDGQFFRGTGSYHVFNTCNTWTAKALYSSGININPAFKLTATSVMSILDEPISYTRHE